MTKPYTILYDLKYAQHNQNAQHKYQLKPRDIQYWVTQTYKNRARQIKKTHTHKSRSYNILIMCNQYLKHLGLYSCSKYQCLNMFFDMGYRWDMFMQILIDDKYLTEKIYDEFEEKLTHLIDINETYMALQILNDTHVTSLYDETQYNELSRLIPIYRKSY